MRATFPSGTVMKRTILGPGGLAVLILLFAAPLSSANAADMPVKAPPPPVVATAYSWTGFYVGGFAGAAWAGRTETTNPCELGTTCPTVGNFDGDPPVNYNFNTSFTGGGVVGYNWQVNPYMVVGLEDKFGYFHLSGAAPFETAPFYYSAFTTFGDWYDAYMARIGATYGHLMLFLEGGGATAQVKTGYINTTTAVTLAITTNKTVTSWAAGGGLEYALDDHWSLEGEVLALGLQSTINGCAPASDALVYCSQSKIGDVIIVDVGIDYAFK